MGGGRRHGNLTTRAIVARAVVWVVVGVLAAALVFAAFLRPWLLGILAAAALVGLVARLTISRREKRRADRGPRAEGARDPDEPAELERLRPRSRHALLPTAVTVALALAVAAGALFSQNLQIDLGPSGPAGPTGPLDDVHRVPYRAVLTFEPEGDWSGTEWFTLKQAEAKALVAPGPGSLKQRLAAGAPTGWSVVSDTTGAATEYRIQRDYPSHPFDVPNSHPLTTSTTLPAPALRSPGYQFPLFAAKGSTIDLHAPEHRIYATAPSSSVAPEAGRRVKRSVKLEVIGAERAGSGVDIEIESDLATHLPQKWIGHGMGALLGGIFSALGLTLGVGFGWLKRAFWWLVHKLSGKERTEHVLGGQVHKTAALVTYLQGKGLTPSAVQLEVTKVLLEAREFAGNLADDASDHKARAKYDAARRRLTQEGQLQPLDVVYAALKAAGIPDGELDVLDATLDKGIIAAHEDPEIAT